MRRLTLSIVLVAAGFAAGLVATGRGRAAEMLRAPESPRPIAEPAQARRPGAVTPAPAAPAPVPPTMGMGGGGPDFTRIAGQAVKGVANISSLQVVRTRKTIRSSATSSGTMTQDRRAIGGR